MSGLVRFLSTGRVAGTVASLLFFYFFGSLVSLAVRGQVLFTDDVPLFFFPFRHWYGECLKNGLSFLWTPDIYGGMYLHGEGQQGMFHPLHLLLYRLLPSTAAFALHTAAAYAWLAGGVYALFRYWKISSASALTGSFLCSFGGYIAVRLVHPPALEVWAHAPWNVLLLAKLAAATSGAQRRRYAAFLALSTASQCLMGHPPFLYLSFLLETICAAAFFLDTREWRGMAAAAGGKLLGLVCGLSQLIPTWEVASTSVRAAASYETLATGSLHPAQFLQWLNPSMTWGDQSRVEYGIFFGAGVLLLAIYYLLSTGADGVSRRLLLWGAGIAILMALGSYTWLFEVTSSLYPFKLFRVSARHMLLTHFFLAAMACLGMDRWVNAPREARANRIARVAAGLWAMGALVLFALRLKMPGTFGGFLTEAFPGVGIAAAGMLTVVFSALAFVAFSYAPVPSWRWGFAAVCLLEVGLFHGRSYWRYPRVELARYMESLGELPPVPAPGPVADRSMTNHLTVAGYRSTAGYVPLKPVMRIDTGDFERLMGARAARGHEQPWRLTDQQVTPPRAWLVAQVKRSENVALEARTADFRSLALTAQDVATDAGATGSVEPGREAPGHLEFAVQTGGRMVLVVTERFDRSWTALLDGAPAPVLRVNGELMGVAVPAGTHTVRLSFAPANLPGLLGLTAAGFAVCLLLLFHVGFRGKNGSR